VSSHPAGNDLLEPALVALPGPRSRGGGAGGPKRLGACPGPVARAARGRSTNLRAAAALAALTVAHPIGRLA
jgi:hypothetical protein